MSARDLSPIGSRNVAQNTLNYVHVETPATLLGHIVRELDAISQTGAAPPEPRDTLNDFFDGGEAAHWFQNPELWERVASPETPPDSLELLLGARRKNTAGPTPNNSRDTAPSVGVVPARNNYTEEHKRRDVAAINHYYSRVMRAKNTELNELYFRWKDSEQQNDRAKTAALYYEWEAKNEHYRRFKQAIALEVFEKVQPLFQRVHERPDAIDLHGQGVHSGSALFVLRTKLDELRARGVRRVQVDVGTPLDGEWHALVLETVTRFLVAGGVRHSVDHAGHFVEVYLK